MRTLFADRMQGRAAAAIRSQFVAADGKQLGGIIGTGRKRTVFRCERSKRGFFRNIVFRIIKNEQYSHVKTDLIKTGSFAVTRGFKSGCTGRTKQGAKLYAADFMQ